MKDQVINDILSQIHHGKRCYLGSEDNELSTVIRLELNREGLYEFQSTASLQHDVVAPAQYDHKLLNEAELREMLKKLSDDFFEKISYIDTRMINEGNQDAADLIFSRLKQRPRNVYVVFKKDRHGTGDEQIQDTHFSGLYKTHQQAEQMVEYLKTKQGVECYWRKLTLSLKDGEVDVQGNVSALDHVNSRQILVTLLAMGRQGIKTFFED